MASKKQTPAANPHLAQLQAIKASLTGGLYMTQAEGADIVAAGLATVDTANVDGDKAFVTLTAAGVAAAGFSTDTPAKPAVAKQTFTIDASVPIPSKSPRKTKEAIYPIEQLEVGQSFHVAVSESNPDPVSRLNATRANYASKYMEEVKGEDGQPIMETVSKKVYQKDAEGKIVIVDGHRVVTSQETATQPKMQPSRVFIVWSVGADDPMGAGARFGRTA